MGTVGLEMQVGHPGPCEEGRAVGEGRPAHGCRSVLLVLPSGSARQIPPWSCRSRWLVGSVRASPEPASARVTSPGPTHPTYGGGDQGLRGAP